MRTIVQLYRFSQWLAMKSNCQRRARASNEAAEDHLLGGKDISLSGGFAHKIEWMIEYFLRNNKLICAE